MNSNLTNVYAYMRKRFPDVDMKFSNAPSYLKTLTSIEKKIIIIYKDVSLFFKFSNCCYIFVNNEIGSNQVSKSTIKWKSEQWSSKKHR